MTNLRDANVVWERTSVAPGPPLCRAPRRPQCSPAPALGPFFSRPLTRAQAGSVLSSGRYPTAFSPNNDGHVNAGQVLNSRSPVMLRLVIVASVLVAFSSTASEARPPRIVGQAPGCNVTMPCDFSNSPTQRVGVNAYGRESQSIRTAGNSAAQCKGRSEWRAWSNRRRAPGRLSPLFLRVRRIHAGVRPHRARIKSCLKLAAVSPDGASAGNGCRATRARLRPGAACRRGYMDGVRCQLGWPRNENPCALVARVHSR